MIAFQVGRAVVQMLVSTSVGACMGNVLKAAIPVTGPAVRRGIALVGEVIVTSMVAHMATTYVMDQVDSIAEKFKKKEAPLDEEPSI